MYFLYSEWDSFCGKLAANGYKSITAASIFSQALKGSPVNAPFVNLKHDVESEPVKALELAKIESQYGHHASYYVQAYLMTDANKPVFDEIQNLGHEVTYHHDVIDGGNGDIGKAKNIFESNLDNFKRLGFNVVTVCQHGNPTSDFDNRDFFKDKSVQILYPELADIMVDFMVKIRHEYTYISDVGMNFKIVKDPTNNIQGNLDKYIELGDVDKVIEKLVVNSQKSYIISSHPHRYNDSKIKAIFKVLVFRSIRGIAKIIFVIPGMKKIVFKFDFISKRF